LGHGFVGTEHILLALFEVAESVAVKVLDELGISKSMVAARVEEMITRATPAGEGKLPFTPRAKAVLRDSVEIALHLGHNYIGTEHILLGLFGEEESVAAKVLRDLGASYEVTRDRTLERLAGYSAD
jgi:ATP-dependent Clp protease ATP-binding subunit ClpA